MLEKMPENDNKNSIDDAYVRYLIDFSTIANFDYFKIMTKFILLTRDYLIKNNLDTANDGTASFPDRCNEFVNDYLEKKTDFKMELNDILDLVQHFCYWLHEKQYTTSILTLQPNDNI